MIYVFIISLILLTLILIKNLGLILSISRLSILIGNEPKILSRAIIIVYTVLEKNPNKLLVNKIIDIIIKDLKKIKNGPSNNK